MDTSERWEYKAVLATKFWSDGYTAKGESDFIPSLKDEGDTGRGHGFRQYYIYSTRALNSLGQEGWELVSANQAGHSQDYYFVFKRRLVCSAMGENYE